MMEKWKNPKANLMNGDVVEMYNGGKYVCLQHAESTSMCLYCFDGGYMNLRDYDDNLRLHHADEDDLEWAIAKVYRPMQKWVVPWLFDKWKDDFELVWQAPKKMTLQEVIAELGYEIEIIKEDE